MARSGEKKRKKWARRIGTEKKREVFCPQVDRRRRGGSPISRKCAVRTKKTGESIYIWEVNSLYTYGIWAYCARIRCQTPPDFSMTALCEG